MADIFLSYASDDRARIVPLVAALEDAGLSVWWDKLLVTGPEFTEAIEKELTGARCVVVVWSKKSIESGWVRDEAQEGLDRNCLVPCCIDDVRPPLGFRSLQTSQLIDWPERLDQLPRLLEGVSTCLSATDSASPTMQLALSRAPENSREHSIVVLPFKNLSSDEGQQYFRDGLVEDIITELSYIKQLMVISRNSSFSYDSDPSNIGKIVSELKVNNVLMGSVRRAGDRMRVSARLIDGRTTEAIWSKRFDCAEKNLFDLQDELTNEIVTALNVNLVAGEDAKRVTKYRNIETRELLYRGMFEYYKFEHISGIKARQFFKQAIDAEPNSIDGYKWLVTTYTFAIIVGWEAPQEALPKLKEWVAKALAIDADDAHALIGDANYKTMTGDLDGAFKSLQLAVESEPNSDEAWFLRGACLMYLGEAPAAIENIKRALRLSPMPNAIRFGVLGTAQRNAKLYQEAVATFEECLRRFPDFVHAHTSLAIVYGMMGNLQAAKTEIQKTLKVDPSYTVQRFINPNFYRSSSIMEQCAKILKEIGLPE